jgi:hypothetical protein
VALGIALLALLAGGCNLRSASPTNADSTNLQIALVGDSIGEHLAKDLRIPSFGGRAGVTWAITAQPEQAGEKEKTLKETGPQVSCKVTLRRGESERRQQVSHPP